jgi:hypothetical protein
MAFEKFSSEQWLAIREVRRDWSVNIDWPKVRSLMEQAGRAYSATETQRAERWRSKAQKEALESAQRHLRHLRVTLSRLGNDLDGMPMDALIIIKKRLDQLAARYQTWCTPFTGRNNRHRERLENQLLAIWEEQLHGRIRTSKNKFGEPIGPLLRYLRRALTPILGESPGPSGLESIVAKAKKRRRRYTPKSRSGRQND